jgi:hypothetical protein
MQFNITFFIEQQYPSLKYKMPKFSVYPQT